MTYCHSDISEQLSATLNQSLFEAISDDLYSQGYSIKPCAFPMALALELKQHAESIKTNEFHTAGIGREQHAATDNSIRSDKTLWITGQNSVEQHWLSWVEEFKNYLNRRLFLGLFSFESHFASYASGQFYKRHLDAFKGQSNRVLSMVLYLNDDWLDEDGGELVLYQDQTDTLGTVVKPTMATLVTFLSEEFPHQVLPAHRKRLSIAGWFSVNRSVNGQLDPPL
ncbi:MAG: 2OG-Fe(II) oxygenase [Gammaproteobacteria bacterium]|nr:2OG-Fe(II) oxygenase [Gammaproteobacteria bacterium]